MAAFCLQKSTIRLENGKEFTRDCGRCDACYQGKLNDIVGRCLLESDMALFTNVVTLTYADDDRYGAIDPIDPWRRSYDDFQRLTKRLRIDGHRFRYVCATELGKKNDRLHYHAVFFWQSKFKAPHIRKEKSHWDYWPHGYAFFDEVNMDALAYVAKYCIKGVKTSEWYDERNPKRSGSRRATGQNERVRMSSGPVFGWGPAQIIGERALEARARELVEKGLPFTRGYKHPKGFYTDRGMNAHTVQYFVRNRTLARLYYNAYCRYYFLKHGKGRPPIASREKIEGEKTVTEAEAVLRLAYGDPIRVQPAKLFGAIERSRDRFWDYPLPAYIDRSEKNISAFSKKVFSTRLTPKSNLCFFKLTDGRFLAALYSDTVGDAKMRLAERQVRIWPVESRAEMRALIRSQQAQEAQRIMRDITGT